MSSRGTMPSSSLPSMLKKGSETGRESRETLLDEGLPKHEKMGQIWKGRGEGDLEKTPQDANLTGSELRITKAPAGVQALY